MGPTMEPPCIETFTLISTSDLQPLPPSSCFAKTGAHGRAHAEEVEELQPDARLFVLALGVVYEGLHGRFLQSGLW